MGKVLINILHLIFRATRPLTLGVRCILHTDNKSVMLVRHTYVSGWHLPGGGVEVGEECEATIIREVGEEANVNLAQSPCIFGIYLNSEVSHRDHVILYHSDNWEKDDNLSLKKLEIAECSMFELTELPVDIDPSTLQRLNEWRGLKKPSLIW